MIASNDILSNLPTSRRQCGLAYFTLHAEKQGVAIAYIMKSANFVGVRSRQMLLLPEF